MGANVPCMTSLLYQHLVRTKHLKQLHNLNVLPKLFTVLCLNSFRNQWTIYSRNLLDQCISCCLLIPIRKWSLFNWIFTSTYGIILIAKFVFKWLHNLWQKFLHHSLLISFLWCWPRKFITTACWYHPPWRNHYESKSDSICWQKKDYYESTLNSMSAEEKLLQNQCHTICM